MRIRLENFFLFFEMFIYAFSYFFCKMTSVSVLEKLINVMYGALIFVILIGVLVVVYNIFWAEKPSIPEQNLDTVFSELRQLEKDSCFDVVIRPFDESYSIILYAWGNSVCNGAPCLAVDYGDVNPRPLVWTEKDCDKGPCVSMRSVVVPANSAGMISICRSKDNELSVK